MTRLFWHDYSYFPYEKDFARREAGVLTRGTLTEKDGCLVAGRVVEESQLRRLTYFKAFALGEKVVVPDQARLEASAATNGSTWDPAVNPIPTLRRQSTRYSAHGLHEYKGKFNPQVVRAIGNMLKIKPGDWILDPFCGSGTTLLEAAHIGWNAVGTDLNPLAVLIANAKVDAFRASPSALMDSLAALEARLRGKDHQAAEWRHLLPNADYLEAWFPESVLSQFANIVTAISTLPDRKLQRVFSVILSDTCRSVSLQDPGDLRIRRRKDAKDFYSAIEVFLNSATAKVNVILRAKRQLKITRAVQVATVSDSRCFAGEIHAVLARHKAEKVNAAICSPPYATALPYIDTQRLSLAVLGLLQASELRRTESELIGNREIGDRQRKELEAEISRNGASLPGEVIAFCQDLQTLADSGEHGFRRRNVPALVYKYLADMGRVFASVAEVVREEGYFALVVGRNRTTLRGKTIEIDTPNLLASIAVGQGWDLNEAVPLNTYKRFDVHCANSITNETLLLLRRRAPTKIYGP